MNTTTVSTHTAVPALAEGSAGMPWAGRAVYRLLRRLSRGTLTVQWPDGRLSHFGECQPDVGLHAVVHLHRWQACQAALRSGDIGFAEAYVAGDWSTPHLVDLLRVFLVNRAALDRVIHGGALGRAWYRVRHWLRRNTRANSRKNIHAHYDLGNGFYRLWLDPTMNYSSAWFDGRPDGDLVQAQQAKVRRALRLAAVESGSRVLEIGCGWGALAECAASEFGAHVTGVTLSTEQLAYARQRLENAGLQERTDLRLQDYRDIQDGPYDAICSIEMIEAVGQAYWPTYFETVQRLLRPGGRACIQSIVIHDALFERYVRSTDFIQQYIFPGGCLPSSQAFEQQAAQAGLRVVDRMAFGGDYAETCRRWRLAFLAQRDAVMAQGFDERFMRLWEFYLAYCEAGFAQGDIDVVQYTLEKP